MPVVTNLMPADGATAVTRRPLFAADIAHPRKKRMDVVFEIENDGDWTTLKTFTGVGDGRYTVKAPKLAGFASEYRWRVRVSSGDNTGVAKAVFTTEPKAHYLGIAYCMGVSWTAQSVTGKGRFRLAYEYHPYQWKELKNDHYVMTREYDRDQGWIEKGYTVAEKKGIDQEQSLLAYWDHRLWYAWKDRDTHRIEYLSGSWEELQEMDPSKATLIYSTKDQPEQSGQFPGIYSFGPDKGWVLAWIHDPNTIYYWEWTKATKKFSGPHKIASPGSNRPRVLQIDEQTLLVYYQRPMGNTAGTMHYVKSSDGGRTWGKDTDTKIPSTGNAAAIDRYGDTYFMMLSDDTRGVTLRTSRDGTNWGEPRVIYNESRENPGDGTYSRWENGYWHPVFSIVDESTILWTVTEKAELDTWGWGWRKQFGGTFDIDTLDADVGTPDKPSPKPGARLDMPFPDDVERVTLQVTAHGKETMDVSFFWADGTYISTHKRVSDGERASVTAELAPGALDREYRWYAVAGGTTYGYWGKPLPMPDHKRSDTWGFRL